MEEKYLKRKVTNLTQLRKQEDSLKKKTSLGCGMQSQLKERESFLYNSKLINGVLNGLYLSMLSQGNMEAGTLSLKYGIGLIEEDLLSHNYEGEYYA